MTSLYFFFLTPIKHKELRKVLAKLLLGEQAQRLAAHCWGEPQHSCFLHTAQTSQEQLGKIWGMLSLRPLQTGKGQDGCLGTATALVWPSTATRFCRTCPNMASGSRSPKKQEHMEDRYFIEKTNQAFPVFKLFYLPMGLRNCTNYYPVVNGAQKMQKRNSSPCQGGISVRKTSFLLFLSFDFPALFPKVLLRKLQGIQADTQIQK